MHFFLRHGNRQAVCFPLLSLTLFSLPEMFAGDPIPHINLNISVNNANNHDQKTSVIQDTDVKNSQAQTQKQAIIPPVDMQKHANDLWELIKSYKFHLLGGSIIAGYSYLFASVLADHIYIKRNDTWSSWKRSSAHELIQDIQINHVSSPDPINASAPLADFMKNIEYEITRIARYIKISTFLQRTKLLLLFPTNNATIELARTKLQRAQSIKQLFVEWAANYKMQHDLKIA